MVKQRRTTALPSILEDRSFSGEQLNQNQKKFNLYNDTIRHKTKKTKDKLLLRLFYLPLIVIVVIVMILLCTVSLTGSTTKFDDTTDFTSSLLLTMTKSSSLKSDKNSSSTTTTTMLKREEEQKQQQEQQQQKYENDEEVEEDLNNHNHINNNKDQDQNQDQHKNNNDLLPNWIIEYVKWHQTQRQLYPGDTLFNATDPNAPKLLVRTCLGICGGLHDRLGQLPFDIYLASKLQRVLLIAWQRPKSLENFLLPPNNNKPSLLPNTDSGKEDPRLYIDWTIPSSQKFGFEDIRTVRSSVPELFEGYPEDHPGDENFWNVGFKQSLKRASASGTTSNKYRTAKILRHRLLGHLDEPILEQLLLEEGYYTDEDDKTHHTPQQLHTTPTFGTIWNLFFKPSPAVEQEIILSLQEMNLLELDHSVDVVNEESVVDIKDIQVKHFTAVHCRVRHPKAHPKGKTTLGINQRYPADKTGLPWITGGNERQFALEIATSALQCAIQITNNTTNVTNNSVNNVSGNDIITQKQSQPQPPIYFLSDSNDLVKHVSIELYDTTSSGYLETNKNNISAIYPPLYDIVHTVSDGNSVGDDNQDNNQGHNQNNNNLIRSRNVTLENTHIDRQKGREPYAYYGTFIDLYITMSAHCVIYGVGYYAAFAAKLSGVHCKYVYVEESWGIQSEKKAQICPNTVL